LFRVVLLSFIISSSVRGTPALKAARTALSFARDKERVDFSDGGFAGCLA
jgi:hypothetical protein